jgi:hypothetical protein
VVWCSGRERALFVVFSEVRGRYGESNLVSTGAEGDDAADGIVGRNADGHAIPGHYLDAEAPHPSAQLGEDFMSCVALHAIKAAGMNRDNGALHVYQIVFAQ